LIRHPLFQYTVAAAITMLLLTTGVFHNIGKITPEPGSTGNSSPPRQEQPSNSFSQRLMERTTTLLDHLQPNRQEGGQSYE
ncbi:MAG: hypothetical protein K0R67_2512, partial [Paenibacillus sp.]|nr:hypothetical protein [Paenibacillus sp.]